MKELYIGLDLHKRQATWKGIDQLRQEVFSRKSSVTPEDIKKTVRTLPISPEKTRLALEPVCGWKWISRMLEEEGVRVCTANPRALRQIAETAKKTDANDALTMAELLRMGYLPKSYRAPDDIEALRILVRHRQHLIKMRTALKCRIDGLATAYGPHLTAFPPSKKRGRQDIFGKEGYWELKDSYGMIDSINLSVKETEKRISEEIASNDRLSRIVEILQSVPGVGLVTAASLAAEIGDFGRFPSPKHLVSYAGLNPKVRQSAGKQRVSRISKEGSHILRCVIVEAAFRVRDKLGSENLHQYYKRMREVNKKSALEARIALARKMIVLIWYMVERNTLYDDSLLKPTQSGNTPV